MTGNFESDHRYHCEPQGGRHQRNRTWDTINISAAVPRVMLGDREFVFLQVTTGTIVSQKEVGISAIRPADPGDGAPSTFLLFFLE